MLNADDVQRAHEAVLDEITKMKEILDPEAFACWFAGKHLAVFIIMKMQGLPQELVDIAYQKTLECAKDAVKLFLDKDKQMQRDKAAQE